MWIPLFGWYVAKMRMIPVNRGKRSSRAEEGVVPAPSANERREPAADHLSRRHARARPATSRPTNRASSRLYAQLGLPVVPVAHVAGLYWPRRKFLRYPGTIKARFLPPIPPGLDRRNSCAG